MIQSINPTIKQSRNQSINPVMTQASNQFSKQAINQPKTCKESSNPAEGRSIKQKAKA
jgi:hypothetical protein